MPRFRYREGYLFCKTCCKQYKEEECPWYESPGKSGMKYRICPTKEHNYHLRKNAHNKDSYKYYERVMKPKLQKDREVIILWKQKRKADINNKIE